MEELENLTWKEMNEKYYGVGDGNHDYAFGYIDRRLGDCLLNTYPAMFDGDGIRIESFGHFILMIYHQNGLLKIYFIVNYVMNLILNAMKILMTLL